MIYRAASIAFQIAGVEKMLLTDAGKLGIGTSTPEDLVEIKANQSAGAGAKLLLRNGAATAANNAAEIAFKTSYDFTSSYYSSRISSVNDGTNNCDLVFYNYDGGTAGGNEKFRVKSNGNVVVNDAIELGNATDTTISRVSAGVIAVEGVTVPTVSSSSTLTNKTLSDASNVLIKTSTVASSATPTPTGDSCINHFSVTALATNATFAAPSGTPTEGNRLTIRVTPDATPRTLAFNAIYRAIGVTLPTTTVASKTMYFGAMYNSTSSTWDITAYSIQA